MVKDPDGTEYVRYDRTYNGLKVLGGDLIVKRKARRSPRSPTTAAPNPSRSPTTPNVSQSAARQGCQVGRVQGPGNKGALVVFATPASPCSPTRS